MSNVFDYTFGNFQSSPKGFGGFSGPSSFTGPLAPITGGVSPGGRAFTVTAPPGQADINQAAQTQFELSNPGIYNQSSGIASGGNLIGGTGPEYSDALTGGLPVRGDSVTMQPASPFFGASTQNEAGTGLFTQTPDGTSPGQQVPNTTGPQAFNQPTPDTGGGGQQFQDPGGGGQQQAQDPGSGGQQDSGGGGSGAGAGGGLPLDIQTLGPGTTQPIQQWVDEALKAGSGWVASAEGVATSAIKAGQTYGATLLGGVTNWFVRGFLIFLGALLVIVGLIVLMWDHGGEQIAVKAGKVVAA